MAIRVQPGTHPHVEWIDLRDNNVMVECAIMKRDGFGNIYYIEIPLLDDIDKDRLVRIIMNRNADAFALWDLMSQITLNNGINALEYFHQLVKIITPDGVLMNPRAGVVGGSIDISDQVQPTAIPQPHQPAAKKTAANKKAVSK